MIQKIFISTALILLTITGFSQTPFLIGLETGFSKELNNVIPTDFSPAINFDFGFSKTITPNTVLRPTIGYSKKGFNETITFANYERQYRTDYHLLTSGLDYQIITKVFNKSFYIFMGQRLGYLISNKFLNPDLNFYDLNPIQWNSRLGFGISLNKNINLETVFELSNISKDRNSVINNRDLFFGIGIKKNIKKATPNKG